MKVLTPEQVLFIHARLVKETGGAHGVRDLGMLLSALARPQATFDGNELYVDVFSKAAVLLHSLVNNHPFVDGNKRTGIACAGIFLRTCGWRLTASNRELESFTLQVATSTISVEEMTRWLRENCREEISK